MRGIWAIFCCDHTQSIRRHRHPYATGEQKRRCWWCDTDTLQKVQAIALKASTGRTRVASNFNCVTPWQIDRQSDRRQDRETDRQTGTQSSETGQGQIAGRQACSCSILTDNDNIEGVWIFRNVLHRSSVQLPLLSLSLSSLHLPHFRSSS